MMESAAVVSQETEVMAKAKRRTFSAKEKLRILQLAEESKKTGEVGAMLRREGIYSSSLTEWRRAKEAGELDALTSKKRGRKARAQNPLEKENAELKRALAKAEARLKRSQARRTVWLVEITGQSLKAAQSAPRRKRPHSLHNAHYQTSLHSEGRG